MGWLGDKIEALIELVLDALQAAFDFVIGWLLAAFNAALDWTKTQFQTLLDFLWSIVDAVWSWISSAVTSVWDAAVQFVYSLFVLAKDWILEWLGGFGEWLDDQAAALGLEISIDDLRTGMTTLADLYADAAWLLPINNVVAVIAGTFVTIAFIRAVRWVISFLWITG